MTFLRIFGVVVTMSAPEIIIPGDITTQRNDYMCHKHLGGCGCVFRSDPPRVATDYEGDIISSTLTCPTCKKSIPVSASFNPTGITYGYIKPR
jgi:hypothetical protein